MAEHDNILGLWVKGKGADGKHKFFPTYRSAVTQRTNNKNSYAIFQFWEGTNVLEVPAAFKNLIVPPHRNLMYIYYKPTHPTLLIKLDALLLHN